MTTVTGPTTKRDGYVFKVGDRIRKFQGDCCSAHDGEEYTVVEDEFDHGNLGVGNDPRSRCHCTGEWILIANKKGMVANLKDSFALLFKGDPEKSFIKSGVINNDSTLTSDGEDIFMAFLLKKFGDEFKKDVVDKILEDKNDTK